MSLFGGHPVPDWAFVIDEGADEARIVARPPLPSGSIVTGYHLTVRRQDGRIRVGETEVGTRLPDCCPELHILRDGTFCLGLESNRMDSSSAAALFWKRLGDFLFHQHVAAEQRMWPAGRWLSHGNVAAEEQLKAERIATENGWLDDYANAIENDEGWIAAAVERGVGPPKIISCPCAKDHGKRCPKRKAVERIVALERRRRRAEDMYMAGLFEDGVRCCGRIDRCGLEGR